MGKSLIEQFGDKLQVIEEKPKTTKKAVKKPEAEAE